MQEHIKKNTPFYTIYAEHRFLPESYATQSAVDVFGSHVVTFTGLYPECFDEDMTLFVLTNQHIASAWRTWFELLW